MGVHLVDPDSKLHWKHDWSGWLESGDTIASRQWSIDPSDVTLANDTSETVTVPAGLTAGKVYRLTEHIVTANGEEQDATIVLRCGER